MHTIARPCKPILSFLTARKGIHVKEKHLFNAVDIHRAPRRRVSHLSTQFDTYRLHHGGDDPRRNLAEEAVLIPAAALDSLDWDDDLIAIDSA